MLFYPLSKAKEVLRFFRDYVAKVPEELSIFLGFVTAPKAPHLPEHIQGTPVLAVIIFYAGTVEEEERIISPSPMSKIMIGHLQGAVNLVGDDKTPYSHRDAPFIINITSIWSDASKNEENIKWARDLWNAVQPFAAGGVYVNFLMTEGADRIMAAYGMKKYEWLVALKNKYDPTNFFSLNQNIKPGK